MTQGNATRRSHCDWCGKPREQWTSGVPFRGMGKHYCSARCYAAGEYRTTLYLALCTIPPLASGVAFLSLQLLSNPSEIHILATVTIVAILLVYSTASAYFPVIGRAERRRRELNSGNDRYWDWTEE